MAKISSNRVAYKNVYHLTVAFIQNLAIPSGYNLHGITSMDIIWSVIYTLLSGTLSREISGHMGIYHMGIFIFG